MASKNVRIKLKSAQLLKLTVAELEQNMRMATVYVRDKVKVKLNRGQPTRRTTGGHIIGLDPSKPGEPPKKVTSRLQNSIRTDVEVKGKKRVLGFVGTDVVYARPLELGSRTMAARPFLRATLIEERPRVKLILTKGKGAF